MEGMGGVPGSEMGREDVEDEVEQGRGEFLLEWRFSGVPHRTCLGDGWETGRVGNVADPGISSGETIQRTRGRRGYR